MKAIRERFAAEVTKVAKQRTEVDSASDKVQTVAVDLTRAGFGRLEDFFAEALLGADVGIVDVFWSEKLQTGERRERLAEERNELIRELESRFTLIRSKLGEGRQ